MVYIKKLKEIRHTAFEADAEYRLGSLEIKMNEIIDKLNETSEKDEKLEG